MYHINTKTDKPDIGRMEATLSHIMARGIRLRDCTSLKDYYVELRESLKNDISEQYHIENPNSSQQVVNYIETLSRNVELTSRNDILNICYDKETDKWTSKAEALEKLSDLGYQFAQDLLDYRHAKKYAESIESIMNAADCNGLIHPTVTLGKTHRINYSNPGLLTIPKKLLWHIISPYNVGNYLYSVDIKNQEPNILINLTGANDLKDALRNKDGLYETLFKQCFIPTAKANVLIDTLPENRVYSSTELKRIGTISPAMYSHTKPETYSVYFDGKRVIAIETVCVGSEKGLYPELPKTVAIELEDGTVQDVPVEWNKSTIETKYKRSADYEVTGNLVGLDIEVSKAERKEFKTAWLAISYGQSIFGVKQTCKTIDGTKVYNFATKNEALKNYRSQIDKLARQGINTIGTAFGTPMYAGEFDDAKKLKRVLLDLPIQGTGADILSLLLKRFDDYCTEKGLTDKLSICYTRHDELIIEVDKDYNDLVGDDTVVEVLKDMLEHQLNDWTPFMVEVSKTSAEKLDINLEDDDE